MPVNVGILGFAHGHPKSYVKRWQDESELGVNVVAVWDHDAERLKEMAESFGLEAYASADEMLARDDIKAVVIAAETSMHADLAEQAAAAGKDIVMQKPLALTMEQADRVVAAVEKHGVRFSMAWLLRTDPQSIQMKSLIDDGAIGRVIMVRRRHGLATHTWDWFPGSWHVKPELNRGMWADDAAHPIDWLLWLLGEAKTVYAEIDTLLDPRVPDDNGIAIFRFEDGTMAEVMSSFTLLAGENTTEIVGEKGVIIQNYGDAPSCATKFDPPTPGLKWYLANDKKWHVSDIASPESHGERIHILAKPLAEFITGKGDPVADVYEGRTALKMLLASYRAAEEGRRIQISEM